MKSFFYYLSLIYLGLLLIIGVISVFSTGLHLLSTPVTPKVVFSFISYSFTLAAVVIAFNGVLGKTKWVISFAYGYIGITFLETVYRIIILKMFSQAVSGIILDILFILPLYVLFSKQKLNKNWLYIGMLIGVGDLLFAVLHY